MKEFELRKVKCYPELSEETECFTAEFWVDGEQIAVVKNDGHGGCNSFTPVKGFTWKDVAPYETIEMECKIYERVIEIDEIRKNQTKGFYVKNKKGEYFTAKFPKPITTLKKYGNYSSWVTAQKAQLESQGFTVLNTNL
jgi:hypothetical protein